MPQEATLEPDFIQYNAFWLHSTEEQAQSFSWSHVAS